MRIAAACAALVAAALALTGCTVQVPGIATAADPAPADRSAPVTPLEETAPPVLGPDGVFTDAQGRFSLVPPPGWTIDVSGTQGTAVVFLDPLPSTSIAGRFSSNINVIVVPSGSDLDATIRGARQELLGLNLYVPTADEAVTLSDGSPAHLLGGTFTDLGTGLALRNVQLFTVRSGVTLVATGTSLQEVWAGYEPTLQSSLRSLTVAA